MKGDVAIHDIFQTQLDSLSEKTGISYTVFFQNVRKVTTLTDADTGLRMEGTTASEAVTSTVISGGSEYLSTDLEIGGKSWYAYYVPVRNSDGSVVGMVFAGRSTDDVDQSISNAAMFMNIVTAVILVASLVFGMYMLMKSRKVVNDVVTGLGKLSQGDLSASFNEKNIYSIRHKTIRKRFKI